VEHNENSFQAVEVGGTLEVDDSAIKNGEANKRGSKKGPLN